jgi:6-pyruvoyltetrahydropterin/6-carboxytetrahydropterin synthase
MPEIALTRVYRFSASHRLHSPLLSPDENLAAYGKCTNPYGHGHDYTIEITVKGPLDARKGRLLPVAALDRLVEKAVIRPMNRRNLNVEVKEFASLVPTTENLAQVIGQRIARAWPAEFADSPVRFEKLRIIETRKNMFEMKAPMATPDNDLNAIQQLEPVKSL